MRKEYYQANKEKISARNKKWREDNKEILRLKKREYHQKNRETILPKLREYSKKNRDKKRIYSRCTLYGLSVEQTKQLEFRPCDICHRRYHKMCVDHDHATGTVRGYLCSPCNTGIGLFRDNAYFLVNALHYLARPPGIQSTLSDGSVK